ncbi:MAG: hypoxanthine/guanine phosphoribosyltransferase [archaeon]|nr:hypoxanthine/guanine phosphoribosyltransferase [archaeon]
MRHMYRRLKDSLEASQIVDKNGYSYFVHPLTDGVPFMEPGILREVLNWMKDVGNFDCDYIVAPESMAIPLAVPLSLELDIPYTVLRKRSYGLPGEVVFQQKTGYADSLMSVNGLKKGDRVVILDDVVSTGGTLDAIIKALRDEVGAVIVDVLVPVNKNCGTDIVLKDTGVTVKTMVSISIVDGKVKAN